MILDTLAEAFQGEYDADGSHTACVSQAKEALIEQEENIDLETALAALELESDTDLEETDVQEIPLAYKEPRQLRREQRVSCDQECGVCSDDVSCQPNVDCEWREWNAWPSCNVTCGEGEYNRSGFEKRHWTRACPITGRQVFRDGEEAKTSFCVHFL